MGNIFSSYDKYIEWLSKSFVFVFTFLNSLSSSKAVLVDTPERFGRRIPEPDLCVY